MTEERQKNNLGENHQGNNDDGNDVQSTSSSSSIMDRYNKALTLVETSPEECVDQLRKIQNDIATLALFSNNETIDEVSTKSIPFVSLEHMLATALMNIPTGPGMMERRKMNLIQSVELWAEFLQRLEVFELLSVDEAKEFHTLIETQTVILQGEDNDNDNNDESTRRSPLPGPTLHLTSNRDRKIARFKAKQQLQKEVERLDALRDRRQRFDIADDDEMDGHDSDSLERTVALAQLSIYRGEALDNWAQTLQELPMIDRMAQMEKERQRMSKHNGDVSNYDPRLAAANQRPLSARPLQLTHITKDAMTGKLQMKKEEIRSKVFRPGWNQPTMSLEELGDREYRAAIEREERQKEAEAKQRTAPKRYEQLVKDGLEDDPDLVDASAQLDRDWDDWKDENPRGSGNKMANRGDKNF